MVGAETAYHLWVGVYTGYATDSLCTHNRFMLSNADNNKKTRLQYAAPPLLPMIGVCDSTGDMNKFSLAESWSIFPLFSCIKSNLNGEYFGSGDNKGYYGGIIWELRPSLKSVAMMVRTWNILA